MPQHKYIEQQGEISMRKGVMSCQIEVKFNNDMHWMLESRIDVKLEVLKKTI